MSTGQPPGGAGRQPTEEELRAAYEAELKKVRVEQILLEQVVSLINLGMRKTGLSPGTEDERDLDQVRLAIEAVRALVPLMEQIAGPEAGAIRDALSQLQLAFVRLGGAPGAAAPGAPGRPEAPQGAPGGPGAGPGEPGGSGGPQPGPSGGGQPASEPPEPEPPKPGEPGPAQRSGKLWVPGQ